MALAHRSLHERVGGRQLSAAPLGSHPDPGGAGVERYGWELAGGDRSRWFAALPLRAKFNALCGARGSMDAQGMTLTVYGRAGGRNGVAVAQALVDPQDVEQAQLHRWYLGGRKRKYVVTCMPGAGTVLLHRLLLGAGPDDRVGHLNGDTLDNRRANLHLLP